MKTLLAFIFIALFTACAPPNVSSTFSPSELREKSGLAIVSVTNKEAGKNKGFNSLASTLHFARVGDNGLLDHETTFQGHTGTINDKHILNNDDYPIGRVIAIQLPEGEYRLMSVESFNAHSVNVPKVSFFVKSGQISYLGNIDVVWNAPTVYMPAYSTRLIDYKLVILDESTRDFSQVSQKWPKIPLDKIVIELIK